MDYNDLPKVGVVLLISGILFAVAIIVLGGFQTGIATSTVVQLESFTTPTDYGNITLAHYRVTSIQAIQNATGFVYPATNYTITDYTKSIVQFNYNLTPCYIGMTCYINYTYSAYDTTPNKAITNSITAITEIPANWFLVIAVIIAASVIVGVLFAAFRSQMGGR